MGLVWLAQDEHLGEPVALKFLPPQIRFDAAAISSLRKETSHSRRLSHPNIVRIHDLHQHNGEEPFIAMEFVDGANLGTLRLQQSGEIFSWEQLSPLVRQLCDALDYAHGEKIVHRDLKPSNLMLDGNGRLKLADFGIATVISDSMTRASGSTSGTPVYMSPQQVNGERPQPTDDIYSLGATLYELLTGTPPFHSGQIIHQILHNEPMPIGERLAELNLQNGIPPTVESAIMACLAKDAAQRPQSAREFFARTCSQTELVPSPAFAETVIEVQPRQLPERFNRKIQPRRRTVWVGLAIFILLLLGVTGWFLKTKRGQASPVAKSEPVIFADDFEKASMDPADSVWDWAGFGDGRNGKSIVTENGNHFVRVEVVDLSKWSDITTSLPIQPGWKELRLSASIRTQGMKTGKDDMDAGAGLFYAFPDQKGAWNSSTCGSTMRLKQNSDWVFRTVTVPIPPWAKSVTLSLSVTKVTGIADFDDIKVEVLEENK